MTAPVDSPALSFVKLAKDLEGLWKMTFDLMAKVDAEGSLYMPPGSRNHLHWNIGHLVFAHVICLHTRIGEPSPFRRDYNDYFGLGSSPEAYDSLVPDWDELLKLARFHSKNIHARIQPNLNKPMTKPLKFMNITMTTPGEALPFLIAHQAEHIGIIKRLVKAWDAVR